MPRASRLMASPSSAPTPSPGAEPPQAGWLTLSSLAEGAPTPEPSADSAAELTTKVSPSRPSPRPAQLASATTSSPVSRRPVKPAGNGPSPQHARAQRAGVTRLATVPEGATSVHAGDAALSTSLPSVAVPRGAVPPPKPHSTLSATAPVPSASTGGTTVSPVKVPAVSVRLPAKPAPSSRPLNATARSTASSTMNSTAPRRGSVPAEGQRAYRRPRRSIFDEYSVNATMSVDSLEDRVGSMAFTYDCDLDRDRPRRQAAERRHSLGSSRSPGSGSLRTGVDSATVGTGTVSASVDDNNSSGKGHRHRRHRRHRRHHRSHSGSAGDASSQPGGDGSGAPESPRRHKRKHHHRHRRHHSSGSGAQGEDPQQPSSVSIVSDDKPEATAACVDIADVKAPPPPLPPADVGHFSRSVPKVGEVGDEVDEDDEEDMMSVLSEGGEKEQKSRQASAANSVAEELDALYELEY